VSTVQPCQRSHPKPRPEKEWQPTLRGPQRPFAAGIASDDMTQHRFRGIGGHVLRFRGGERLPEQENPQIDGDSGNVFLSDSLQ